MIYIYGLFCPVAQQIRYIGKAINPEARLRDHVMKAGKEAGHKSRWLAKLKAQGLKPTLEIIRRLEEGEDWQVAERDEIRLGFERGWPLTNVSAGGEGVLIVDPETEARRIRRTREAWASPELRARHAKTIAAARSSDEQRQLTSERSREMWSDPSHREKVRASCKTAWSAPDKRAAKSEEMRRIAADPADLERRRRAAIAHNARPEVRRARSEFMKEQWQSPETKAKRLEAASRPETRAAQSRAAKARWADPEKRTAAAAANSTPEKRARLSEMARRRATPEYRAMMAEKTRLSWLKRRERSDANTRPDDRSHGDVAEGTSVS